MTSKLTREERVQSLYDLKIGQVLNQSDIESIKMLARMALAAMESKPVKRFNADQMHRICLEANRHLDKYGAMAKEVNKLLGRIQAQPAKGLESAGWQFKSVNGDWLGLIDEHGKNQAVREGCEVREVFAMADGVNERDQVRREHAEWSQATFGNVGPVGPLKHLSKEALEAAAEPGDLSEWADMQFLLWDAQRRAGITDEQITQAMIEKLAVNKRRSWPEPKDGEPRLHIKEQPAPIASVCTCPSGDGSLRWPCPVHPGKSPAQSDCCPAQNSVNPEQSPIDHGYRPECECSGCKATARICTEMAVNSLVIPNEMTSEQAYEIGYYYGDPVNVFARGANWMRQHIIDSTLAAAPQETNS